MEETFEHFYQDTKLSVRKHRKRIGCDICKKDTSTEEFIGFCGNVLWICGKCFIKIISKSKEDAKAKKGVQK